MKYKKFMSLVVSSIMAFSLVSCGEKESSNVASENTGEEVVIKKISGSDKTRTFLNSIGFVVGTNVKIVSKIDGNLIIDVKDTRVALDKKMASRIII